MKWIKFTRWLDLPLWGKLRYSKFGSPDPLHFTSLTILGHRPHAPLRSDVDRQQERAQKNVLAYLREFREKK